MIPGIWLELEVIGIHSPKLAELSDDCFFKRHGRRIYDRSRYQLDFRNPEVIAHANEVIDRVVNEYGVGYIKMDYNIERGSERNWMQTVLEKDCLHMREHIWPGGYGI